VQAASGRRLSREARRRQLLELGLEMLSSEPRELVALDRISEVAGVSRGLLFHYFPTKRAYHLAVVETACARLLERTEPDPALPAGGQLRASLEAFIDFVSENEELYRALIRGAAGADGELEAPFERTRETIAERVLERLDAASGGPAQRSAVRGWIGFVEESTLDWLRHGDLERQALVELQSSALESIVAAVAGISGR
jgi:AcrR family transcriptional regulator